MHSSISHTYTHTHHQHQQQGPGTHPRVLMKPLTEPSAYRDTMSPIWRKLEAESDILQLVPRLQQRQKAQVHQVETFSCRLGAPSLTQSRTVLTCSRAGSAQTGSSTCPDRPRSPHRSQTETLPGCTSARGLQRYGRAPLPLRAAGYRVRASVRASVRACVSVRNCLCMWVCVSGRARPRRQTSAIQEKKKRNQEVGEGVD